MKHWIGGLVMASMCGWLSGCGGSSSSGDLESKEVRSVGTVTGVGSVIVNGVRFESEAATVTVNDEAATAAQLKVGMVVEVEGSVRACPNADNALCEGIASRIRFRNNLEGPITSINVFANTLQVMGRTISVDESTLIEGAVAGDLSVLSVGDSVSVSGLVEGSRVRARLLQRTGTIQPGVTPLLLYGLAAGVDSLSGTCTVDGIRVSFEGLSTTDLPAGGLSNGQFVQILGRGFSDGSVTADRVQLRDRISFPDESLVELEGFVSDFASAGNFRVDGQQVDASAAVFRNGTAADLRDGLSVEIEGTMAGSLLLASKVILRQEANAQIVAPIQSKNSSAASLVMLGQSVSTTPLTLFLDSSGPGGRATPSLAYADLQVGDRVDVRIRRDAANQWVAIRVERTDPDPVLIAKGPVDDKTPPTRFSLLGIEVDTGPGTRYRDALGALISDTEFYASLQVPPNPPSVVRTQGVASTSNLIRIDATRILSTRGEVEIAR